MDLASYMAGENLKDGDFAEKSGIPRVTIRQYRLKQRVRISESNLKKILEATDGKVTANDFYGVSTITGGAATTGQAA